MIDIKTKICKCGAEFTPIVGLNGIAKSNLCSECWFKNERAKRTLKASVRVIREENGLKRALESKRAVVRKPRTSNISKIQKMFEKQRSKYGSTKQTFNGRSYDSKLEANYAAQLELRKLAGEIKEIFPQYKLDLRANNFHITNYFIDFKIILSDDKVELIEVKGFETDVWRIKWRLTQALLEEIEPGAKLILVK